MVIGNMELSIGYIESIRTDCVNDWTRGPSSG